MKARRRTVFAALLLGCAMGITACSQETSGEPGQQEGKESEAVSEQQETPKEAQEPETKTESVEGAVTLGETADILVETATKYGNQIDRNTLLKELEEREGEPATGIDMLVIVSRAFGKLPDPEESKKEQEEVSLDGVPEWALEDVEKLNKVGALRNSDLESGKDPVTREDVEQMIQRVMNLYSS